MKSSRRVPSTQQLFARLQWELRRHSSHPHAGYAVAVLLIFVTVVLAASGFSDQTKAASNRKQLSTLRAPVKLDPQSNAAAMLTAALPSSREVPVHLRNLYAAADKAKVELTIAEYRTRVQPAAGFSTVSLGITVESDFPRIQRMLIDAMTRSRTLTLESMSIQRIADNSDDVEARLNLQLYVRSAERGP